MPHVTVSKDNASSLPGYQPMSATEARWFLVWVMLVSGALLVGFAAPLGIELVKEHHGPGSYGWSPDKARDTALAIRCLGCLVFSAGLVERLVIAISKLNK